MSSPRGSLPKIPIYSFTGGMNEFEGEVAEGQFLDGRNVEAFHGELRTRPGQRLVGAPYPSVVWNTIGTPVDGRPQYWSTNPQGLTVGGFWYVSILELNGNVMGYGALKFAAAFLNPGTNPTPVTAQWEYYSTSAAEWRALAAQEIGLEGGYPRVASHHLQYSPFLVVLNGGDDAFFEDWGLFTVGADTRYYVRARIVSGTNDMGLAGDLQESPGAVPTTRPTLLHAGTARDGRRLFALGLPQPMPETLESGVRIPWYMGLHQVGARILAGTASALGTSLDRWGTPIFRNTGGLPPPEDVNHRLPRAGFSMEGYSFTAANPIIPQRVMLPNTPSAYVAETGRLIVGTDTGIAALMPPGHEASDVRFEDRPDDIPLSWVDYPTFNADRMPALYGTDRPILRHAHVGPVDALNVFDGHVFALIGDRLQWSLGVPYEDIWVPEAFTTISDSNGASGRGLLSYSGQNLCFMDDSIHAAEPFGDQKLGPAQVQAYRTRRVVGGVGAVGHAAIIDAGGLPMFLARDGVRAFDGSQDPPLVSSAIQSTWERRVSQPGLAYAVGAFHQTKRQAWFAVRRAGSVRNDLVIMIDLRHGGGVFLFEGIEAEQMVYDATEGVIYTADSRGFVWQQGFGYADGFAGDRGITAYVETGPLTSREHLFVVARSVALRMRRFAGVQYRLTPIVDGVAMTGDRVRTFGLDRLSSDALYPPDESELAWGSAGATWTGDASLPSHETRTVRRDVDALEGTELRLRIEVDSPAPGDLLSLLNLAALVNPQGVP